MAAAKKSKGTVGVIGLTQVIPPTGAQIARSLGLDGPTDLAQPATSLRFGAHYLAVQLGRFDGDVFMALAAYNGGPENAARWGDDQRLPGADGAPTWVVRAYWNPWARLIFLGPLFMAIGGLILIPIAAPPVKLSPY